MRKHNDSNDPKDPEELSTDAAVTVLADKPPADPPAEEKPEQLIYIGPNITGGRLASATVFRNGMPGHLQDLRDKHPEVDVLTVPVNELTAATAKMREPGTPEYAAYQTLVTS